MTRSSKLLLTLCAAAVLGSRSSPLDDGVALLQSTSGGNPERSRALLHMFSKLVKGTMNTSSAAFSNFDCKSHPHFCKEPFMCHEITMDRAMNWMQEGIGSKGPDHGALCTMARNELYFHECLANRNAVKASHMQYLVTRENLLEEGDPEGDASFCFIEGLCVEDLNESSTLDDIVKVCDRRYGHELWTRFGSEKNPDETSINAHGEVPKGQGFSSRSQSLPFGLSTCAVGTLHCDVVSCKETYCKDQHAIRRYHHLMEREGWLARPHLQGA